MRRAYYVLDDERRPVATDDREAWARCFEDRERCRVGDTKIGPIRVSTVFLGRDHRFLGDGPPLLFETKVFGDEALDEMHRYVSWDDAEAGHAATVNRWRDRVARAEALAKLPKAASQGAEAGEAEMPRPTQRRADD